MPKYRLLSKDELEELREEFIRFLAAHSIPAQDWQKMKKEEPDKAEKWIELFSDMVLDTVLKNIEILELRSEKEIKFLTFDENQTYMVGLVVDGADSINFTANEDASEMITKFQNEGGQLRIITGERPHEGNREEEVYKNLGYGYLITKNRPLYESLRKLVDNQSSEN